MKEVKVIVIDNAKIVFLQLKDQSILRSLEQKFERIKENPFYGDNIPKKLLPKRYDVSNLWRVELPKFWRMLYTIKGNQRTTYCFVIDIVDHKEYNKIFGYKR